MSKTESYDVVLIGGGVMSATLGTLLKSLDPSLSIIIYERLPEVAEESTNPWNNAGTGHAALCELNYMPDNPNGGLPDASKAIGINEQFQLTRQFWSHLVDTGVIADPKSFINPVPHMTFVRGAKDVDYLKRRFQALKDQPLFAGMEFTEDRSIIAEWAPLLMQGRTTSDEPFAATRIASGTDVDFGSLTRQLLNHLTNQGVSVATSHEVRGLKKNDSGWSIRVHDNVSGHSQTVRSKFVFVGAGGWALKLLQKSGIPEVSGFGTFPISGEFFRTDNPVLVAQHNAKVYSQAAVGAPPMSVPHLDTRVVDGKKSLLFGPYAGANPKFLKNGSILDLPMSIRPGNVMPYLSVAAKNLGLLKYLIGELLTTKAGKFEALKQFVPSAKGEDWYLITAGQRAQVIRRIGGRGHLQFGTEVISAADGSISGLLGASPGASTAVPIMLEVIEACFPQRFDEWRPKIQSMLPTFGKKLAQDAELVAATLASTAASLQLNQN